MESTLPCNLCFISLIIIIAYKCYSQGRPKHNQNLPPSPPSLPIIGHLHLMKEPLHQTLSKFAKTLGPVFSLQLGSRLVVVISSASAAEECFTKNDIVLANRPKTIGLEYFGYNYTTLFATSYGDHWRKLRRIMAHEIFLATRLDRLIEARQDETMVFLRSLYNMSPPSSSPDSCGFTRVEMRTKFSALTFNMAVKMIAGKHFFTDDVSNYKEVNEFQNLLYETSENSSYLGDFLPCLGPIISRKYIKNVAQIHKELDVRVDRLINELRYDKGKYSMINHLLLLQELRPECYTDDVIKGLVYVSMQAAMGAPAVTLEWALALLMNHPDVLTKARAEIDAFVGKDRLIKEKDIPKLPYLQAIIFENFRLFPPRPLLIPHESSQDCTIGGFDVPHGTIVIFNGKTIQRDPIYWDDPDKFRPERFEDVVGGFSYKFMPFGMGTRVCPASGLAQKLLGLALGSIIQCFEWEIPEGKEVDMKEGSEFVSQKLEPLEIMCKPRDIAHKIFSDGYFGT